MSFVKRSYVCGFSAALVLWSAPAMGQNLASFSIPVFASRLEGATFGASSIVLPSSGTPDFTVNFVLPRDYVINGEVLVVIYLTTPTVPCSIRFVPSALVRQRGNATSVSGLVGINGGSPVVNFPTTGATVLKNFRIAPGGIVADQRRGDSIFLRLTREADDATDTCPDNAFVVGIDVRYPVP